MNKIHAWIAKIKIWFSIFMAYLTIAGLSSFAMFIIEESFQTVMFGTWQAIACEDWPLVKKGSVLMTKINGSLKIVNYTTGWINPLAFVAYYDYGKASEFYIDALNARIFANCPECYDGEVVTFKFKPDEIENAANHVLLRSRNIEVIAQAAPPEGTIVVKGKVANKDGRILVTNTTIK